jgi:hypothetical protein
VRRRRRRRRTALIKSNNPHLAGGEKVNAFAILHPDGLVSKRGIYEYSII